MEKNKEPDEKSRSGRTYRHYKGTITDEDAKFIIRHLSYALELADPDILKVIPSEGKRAAVTVYKNGSTLFIPVEGDSPLQMMADVINRCLLKQGIVD